jgi:hypothetical protein
LEYYAGILFLTTNRVGVFDEAFKSRIHLSLYYPTLSREQTTNIWSTHIATAASNDRIVLKESDLKKLAEEIWTRQCNPEFGPVWNGRQIRNAFQSAVALAEFHSEPGYKVKLEREHFLRVFTASDEFSNYVWKMKKSHTDADWNKMWMTRRDDYVYQPTYPGQGPMVPAAVPSAQPGPTNQPSFFPQQQPQSAWVPESTFGQQSFPRQPAPFGSMAAQQYNPMAGMVPGAVQAPQFVNTQAYGNTPYSQGTGLQVPAQFQAQQPQMQPQSSLQPQPQPGNPSQMYQPYVQQQPNYGAQGQPQPPLMPVATPPTGQQMAQPMQQQQPQQPLPQQPLQQHQVPSETAPGSSGFQSQMQQVPPQ